MTDEEADQLILQWTEVAEGGREAAGKHVRAAQAASEEAQQDQLAVPEADVPFVMYFGKYNKKPKGPSTSGRLCAQTAIILLICACRAYSKTDLSWFES